MTDTTTDTAHMYAGDDPVDELAVALRTLANRAGALTKAGIPAHNIIAAVMDGIDHATGEDGTAGQAYSNNIRSDERERITLLLLDHRDHLASLCAEPAELVAYIHNLGNRL